MGISFAVLATEFEARRDNHMCEPAARRGGRRKGATTRDRRPPPAEATTWAHATAGLQASLPLCRGVLPCSVNPLRRSALAWISGRRRARAWLLLPRRAWSSLSSLFLGRRQPLIFSSPFPLLARSKNGLLWVPRIVLSRGSVYPGDMKEMRGRRDFPVLLEETAAGG
jgi:hypothetical protein